eukprot:scaffold24346_cov64-Phaeocystis_antarctica.AAC.3
MSMAKAPWLAARCPCGHPSLPRPAYHSLLKVAWIHEHGHGTSARSRSKSLRAYSLLTTHCSLLTTHYSLLTTHYSLLTTL